MKKINKSNIFSFILGALLFSGITGVLAYKLAANQVGFTPSDSTWQVSDVDNALDSLFDMATYGDASASDIVSGKTALVNGAQVTGNLTVPSYTSLSGTQNVSAGSSSTTLNGYYNLSNYKVSCGTNSCPACNSCCSCPRMASGTVQTSSGSSGTVNCGFSPSFVALIRDDGVSTMVKRGSYSRNVGGSSFSSYTEHIIFTSSGFYIQGLKSQIGTNNTFYYLCA